MAYIPRLFAVYIKSNVYSPSLRLKTAQTPFNQGAISRATMRPLVAASAGALALAGSPSIRAFVAKSKFVAIYALLDVPFSAPAYTRLS